MKNKLIVVALAAVVAVVISSAVIANLGAGTKAPNFTLKTLDGKSFTLQNNFKQGKVVLLDIWATWCPPCRAEIPYLVDLNKKYKGKSVVFVGVAIDQSKSDVSDFAKKNKINYTVCSDPNGATVGEKYQVRGIPATYIIDKKGVVRFVHSGFGGKSEIDKMDKEIASLLK